MCIVTSCTIFNIVSREDIKDTSQQTIQASRRMHPREKEPHGQRPRPKDPASPVGNSKKGDNHGWGQKGTVGTLTIAHIWMYVSQHVEPCEPL